LLLVCAVVGLPGVGVPVTGVDWATVGVGVSVGVTVAAAGVTVGVGVLVGSGVVVRSLGRTDSTAAGPGVTDGRVAGLAASGNGISGVSRLGPPSRLLAISNR
jgi:hypothetical protein